MPHAVFEEPTTVAGKIKPEIVRLAYCARGHPLRRGGEPPVSGPTEDGFQERAFVHGLGSAGFSVSTLAPAVLHR